MQAVVDSFRGERGADLHCVRERDCSCDLYIDCLILTDKYSAARKLKLELFPYEHHVAAPDCRAAEPRAERGEVQHGSEWCAFARFIPVVKQDKAYELILFAMETKSRH